MKLARLAVVLFFATLAMPAAHAAEPTIDEKIRYLLQGSDSAENRDATFAQVSSTMRSSFKNLPPEAIDRIVIIVRREFEKVFSDGISLYVDVYKVTYSKEEIDAMYDFYMTPVGAGIVAKNSTLAKEMMAAKGDRIALFYKRIMQEAVTDPELNRLLSKPPKDL